MHADRVAKGAAKTDGSEPELVAAYAVREETGTVAGNGGRTAPALVGQERGRRFADGTIVTGNAQGTRGPGDRPHGRVAYSASVSLPSGTIPDGRVQRPGADARGRLRVVRLRGLGRSALVGRRRSNGGRGCGGEQRRRPVPGVVRGRVAGPIGAGARRERQRRHCRVHVRGGRRRVGRPRCPRGDETAAKRGDRRELVQLEPAHGVLQHAVQGASQVVAEEVSAALVPLDLRPLPSRIAPFTHRTARHRANTAIAYRRRDVGALQFGSDFGVLRVAL